MNHHLFLRATGKLLVAMTMVVSSLSGALALSASSVSAAAASSGPIDLPAAVPTVAQLDKAGLTGFVPNGAADVTLDDYLLYSTKGAVRDQREKDMKAAGFVHQYEKYWIPANANDNLDAKGNAQTQLLTYVKYFKTETGAKKGYDVENTSAAAKGTKDNAFGDASRITTYKDTTSGTTYTAYDIVIRVGRVTGGVSLLVTKDSPEVGSEIKLLEKLAPYIVKDFTAADTGKTPNLGLYAPVYATPAGPVGGDSYYYILGKVTGLLYGEKQSDADSRATYYKDNKADAVYSINQSIDPSGKDPYTSNYLITTQLWSFGSAADAATWLSNQNEATKTNSSNANVKTIKVSSASLPAGVDDAAIYSYAFTGNSGFTTQANAVIGKVGVTIYIDSTLAVPGKDAILALLGVQADCVSNGQCTEREKVPADVISDVNKLDKQLPPGTPAAPATPTGDVTRGLIAA